jgi:hypothetical protein
MSVVRRSVRVVKKEQRDVAAKDEEASLVQTMTESELRRNIIRTIASWVEARRRIKASLS